MPRDLSVEAVLEDGRRQVIYFDTNYNSSFALMHEDYLDDAIPVDLATQLLRVHILAPVDLVVSKIARLAENDRDDIRALVGLGLVSASAIERRAMEALVGYVGGQGPLLANLRDALTIAQEAERA